MIAADRVEKFYLAALRRCDHLRQFQTWARRHRVIPEIRKAPCVVVVDGEAAGKVIRLRAAVAAGLAAAVAADRHDAAFFPPQHTARERQIGDGSKFIDARLLLEKSHAAYQYSAFRLTVEVGKALDPAARHSGKLFQH